MSDGTPDSLTIDYSSTSKLIFDYGPFMIGTHDPIGEGGWSEGCYCWSCFKHRRDAFVYRINQGKDNPKLSELIEIAESVGLQLEITLREKHGAYRLDHIGEDIGL